MIDYQLLVTHKGETNLYYFFNNKSFNWLIILIQSISGVLFSQLLIKEILKLEFSMFIVLTYLHSSSHLSQQQKRVSADSSSYTPHLKIPLRNLLRGTTYENRTSFIWTIFIPITTINNRKLYSQFTF